MSVKVGPSSLASKEVFAVLLKILHDGSVAKIFAIKNKLSSWLKVRDQTNTPSPTIGTGRTNPCLNTCNQLRNPTAELVIV
jgi:hypothetical protein